MNSDLREIRLYGKMGARFGRSFRLAVNSPAEAMQALGAMLPGFREYMYGAKDQGIRFAVFVGKTNIGEDEVSNLVGNNSIRIAPVIEGAKSPFVQIVVGTVLMVAAFFVPNPMVASALFSMGASMVLGGIIQLLTPVPKKQSAGDKEDPNYSFNGPVNTTAQGHPVPLLYGRMKVGSAVISAGITLKDENFVPPTAPPSSGSRFLDLVYLGMTRGTT